MDQDDNSQLQTKETEVGAIGASSYEEDQEDQRSNISLWQRRYDRKLLDLEFHFSAGPLRVVPIPHHWDLLRRKYKSCIPKPSGEISLDVDNVYRKSWQDRKNAQTKQPSDILAPPPPLVTNNASARVTTMLRIPPRPSSATPKPERPQQLPLAPSDGLLHRLPPKPPTPYNFRNKNIYGQQHTMAIDDGEKSDFTATTVVGVMRPKSAAMNKIATIPPLAVGIASRRPASAASSVNSTSSMSKKLHGIQHQLDDERNQRTKMEQEIAVVSRQLSALRRALKLE
eukprot:PhF_6_TR9769/c0_g1_i2/m.15057